MTSRHASGGGRRGIATWIIVTAVATVLVVGAGLAYFLIVSGSEGKAGVCRSQAVLPIVAAPGAAESITAAATAFDATAPVARSACISTTVASLPDDQAGRALADEWQQAAGTPPAIWAPDTGAALVRLEATNSPMTAGRDTSPLATSPVVIAVRDADAAGVQAAGLSWRDLTAATGPDGTVALPSNRHLVAAMPDPSTNRATSYALQSVIAARTGGTIDVQSVTANAAELASIGAGGPTPQPATTDQALSELLSGGPRFTAVPVVASDLAAFSAANPGLTAISPTGAAVGDAVFAVPLTASWVNPTLKDAAALFLAYLRGPGGDAAFADHGLQLASADLGPAPTRSSTAPADPGSASPGAAPDTDGALPDAGPAVAAALAEAIGANPAG